jgi:hypothetical protein
LATACRVVIQRRPAVRLWKSFPDWPITNPKWTISRFMALRDDKKAKAVRRFENLAAFAT